MNTITLIVVYYGFSIVFVISVVIFLWKRKKRHRNNYPKDWKHLKHAIEEENINDLAKYGSRVIWNDNLEAQHKKIIYREIEKRKDNYPELQKLWKDVYYKMNGLEPSQD